MKIGVYISSEKGDGGVYQYSLSILEALARLKEHDYLIFTTSADLPERFRKIKRFKFIDLNVPKRSSFYELRNTITSNDSPIVNYIFDTVYKAGAFVLVKYLLKIGQSNVINEIEKHRLDCVIYPATSSVSFLAKTPSMTSVHDLQHIVMPHFKEATSWGRREYRNFLYKEISKSARVILVNSDVGKKDIIKYFKPNRVEVLPYLPSSFLDNNVSKKELEKVKEKYILPDSYFFYPAKFWPHKNHLRVIKAIKILRDKGIDASLVLTGSKRADFSTFRQVMKLTGDFGLMENIIFLGYLDGRDFSAIYKMAKGLVMPTFFGPTNIPIYEAWYMGIPIITSDLRGCREQVEDGSGLVVNPNNVRDIASKMERLYKDPVLCKSLIEKGRNNLEKWTIKEFSHRLGEIIENV